jgi:NAD(P)-dependent dehydrogenase (short-subunit alcohol dehydrogenase family)
MKKVAFITGGTGGLGLTIVKDLLDKGYEVVSVSREEEKIQKAEAWIGSKKAVFLQGDITQKETLEKVYHYLLDHYGYVNVLINNVGAMAGGGMEEITAEQWEGIFEINVHVPFRVIKKLMRLLKRSENGCIINISSIASKITGGCMAYSASKAAMDMMTRSLAKELAEYYIRVNSVNPGLINTGFQVNHRLMKADDYEEFLEDASKDYPMGTGTAADVSNLVCYLISKEARWITGSNYIIDGGRSVNL